MKPLISLLHPNVLTYLRSALYPQNLLNASAAEGTGTIFSDTFCSQFLTDREGIIKTSSYRLS
jgi:hypothetical protein